MEDLFFSTLNEHGECWVNYLQGASYHYLLIDGAIYENGAVLNYCGCIDEPSNVMDYVDLSLVSSITSCKIR